MSGENMPGDRDPHTQMTGINNAFNLLVAGVISRAEFDRIMSGLKQDLRFEGVSFPTQSQIQAFNSAAIARLNGGK